MLSLQQLFMDSVLSPTAGSFQNRITNYNPRGATLRDMEALKPPLPIQRVAFWVTTIDWRGGVRTDRKFGIPRSPAYTP